MLENLRAQGHDACNLLSNDSMAQEREKDTHTHIPQQVLTMLTYVVGFTLLNCQHQPVWRNEWYIIHFQLLSIFFTERMIISSSIIKGGPVFMSLCHMA